MPTSHGGVTVPVTAGGQPGTSCAARCSVHMGVQFGGLGKGWAQLSHTHRASSSSSSSRTIHVRADRLP